MEPSVYVRVHGGLGNQLFEYAAGRALSLRLRLPLVLDLSWFGRKNPGETVRQCGLTAFSLPAAVASRQQLMHLAQFSIVRRFGLVPISEFVTFVGEPYRHYWPEFTKITGAAYMSGLWQSPRYFAEFADYVRADFRFPPLQNDAARVVADQIAAATTAVSVHVRRGDFVSLAKESVRRSSSCTPEYYARAVDTLAGRHGPITLFLFSDEPDWVRSNFDVRGHMSVVVDIPDHAAAPYHDLHLMSLARHHIIANSTFSWWGAWLAQKHGQSVIAPSVWVSDRRYSTKDRYPPSWTMLSGTGEEVPLSLP